MFSLGQGDDEEFFTINNVRVDKDLFAFRGLILDESSVQIVSSVCHSSDLRLSNIAFSSKIVDSKRGVIRETPILYFVTPSDQNLQIIVEDCAKQLYDYVFLEFLGPVSN